MENIWLFIGFHFVKLEYWESILKIMREYINATIFLFPGSETKMSQDTAVCFITVFTKLLVSSKVHMLIYIHNNFQYA